MAGRWASLAGAVAVLGIWAGAPASAAPGAAGVVAAAVPSQHDLRSVVAGRTHYASPGVCPGTAALDCAINTAGADRIMFSVDYPYEDMAEASDLVRVLRHLRS